jgi:hypothetical protein
MENRIRNYNLIPDELKRENIWLIAADVDGNIGGKIPHTLTNQDKLVKCNINIKSHLMPFSVAFSFADAHGYDIGAVMNTDHHFGVIDLDIKDFTTKESIEMMHEIISKFDSYTELSTYGMGYHIIFKTDEFISRRSSKYKIEAYSFRRFIVVTGNIVTPVAKAMPDGTMNYSIERTFEKINDTDLRVSEIEKFAKRIEYRNEALLALVDKLGLQADPEFDFVLKEVESDLTDDEVIDWILDSPWCDKYLELSLITESTDLVSFNYPSLSEVDLALICILGRATPSDSQVRRIFRTTPVGQRAKHQGTNYRIDRCLIKIRDELDLTSMTELFDSIIDSYFKTTNDRITAELDYAKSKRDAAIENNMDVDDLKYDFDADELEFFAEEDLFKTDIPFPHGLIGDISKYIYNASPYKLKEAAIGASLALISGICGRQWNFNGAGLNNYFVILAASGLGKESVSRSLGVIVNAIAKVNGDEFVCFDRLSSGQAFKSVITSSPYHSILVVMPEFARLVDALKNKNDAAMSGLYNELLDAHSKSAPKSTYGGSRHADTANNRTGVTGAAISLIGDCTLDYYEGITESMAKSGFISRFVLIERYSTHKGMSDKCAHLTQLDQNIVTDLCDLVIQAKLNHEQEYVEQVVPANKQVELAMLNLEVYINMRFNQGIDEMQRQPFARAYLKVMTIASLFAVTRNRYKPEITLEDFEWAKALVLRDCFNLIKRIKEGTIGIGENNCKKRTTTLIKRLIDPNEPRDKVSKEWAYLLDNGVVPKSLLAKKLNNDTYRIGHMSNTATLNVILKEMVETGDLIPFNEAIRLEKHIVPPVGKTKMFSGVAYLVCF